MNYTITLTPDQMRFVTQLVKDATVEHAVRQSPARNAFGIRILEAFGDYSHTVDHSTSAKLINDKLASGELKFPSVS